MSEVKYNASEFAADAKNFEKAYQSYLESGEQLDLDKASKVYSDALAKEFDARADAWPARAKIQYPDWRDRVHQDAKEALDPIFDKIELSLKSEWEDKQKKVEAETDKTDSHVQLLPFVGQRVEFSGVLGSVDLTDDADVLKATVKNLTVVNNGQTIRFAEFEMPLQKEVAMPLLQKIGNTVAFSGVVAQQGQQLNFDKIESSNKSDFQKSSNTTESNNSGIGNVLFNVISGAKSKPNNDEKKTNSSFGTAFGTLFGDSKPNLEAEETTASNENDVDDFTILIPNTEGKFGGKLAAVIKKEGYTVIDIQDVIFTTGATMTSLRGKMEGFPIYAGLAESQLRDVASGVLDDDAKKVTVRYRTDSNGIVIMEKILFGGINFQYAF